MDEFLTEMAEILEEDAVAPTDELKTFESWDSLAALSVAAMADERFNVNMTAQEINRAGTVADLYHAIVNKQAA
jgi:acyl carrier protein